MKKILSIALIIIMFFGIGGIKHKTKYININNIKITPIQEQTATKKIETIKYNAKIPLNSNEQTALYDACDEFGIDYALLLGIIDVETDFNNVVGDGGNSFGYMQIQPKWHKERMAQINAKNLMIPKDNFRTGANFLAELLSKHELTDSLTYYNQGHFGNSNYANSVIKAMNYWKEVIKTNGCENY